MNTSDTHENTDDQLPEGVVESLRQMYRRQTDIPSQRDNQILQDAAQHLQRSVQPVRRARPRRLWAFAAASLVSAAGILLMLRTDPMSSDLSPTADLSLQSSHAEDDAVAFDRSDIDRNGQVDILDAFALARHLDSNPPANADWDQNGDGQLNQYDVDHVARIAVML
jgi:hypothetical protein